jgi:PII-like signaling protein
MEGCFLRFYLPENQRCGGRLAWEWLLDQANALGIRGGSAFRAMGGFGHHHHLQEAQFFELAGDLAVEVEFIVSEGESRELLELLQREKLRVFYARVPATFGVVNPDADDPPPPP